jgi:hypothetical protein
MLAPIALALALVALLLAAGALAMTMQTRKEFRSLLEDVRRIEDRPMPAQLPEAKPPPQAEAPPPPAQPAEPPRPALHPPRPEPPAPSPAPREPSPSEKPRPASPRPDPSPAPAAEPEPVVDPAPAAAPAPEPDPAWQAWLEQLRALPHGAVAALLGEVLQHSKHLARGFAHEAQRAAFAQELGEGFQRRLSRFQQCARDEATFEERWVEPDLITALDLMARFQSQAAADARDGHAPAAQLAAWLAGALYDQLGPACRAEGWFALERILPFETRFDPGLHKGVDGRQVAGARGLVVEVERVGRLHPVEGYPLDKAHVVVGR